MPIFVRHQLIEGTRIEVRYSEADPGRLESEGPAIGSRDGPEDGLLGARAVQIFMDSKLEKIQ
jgi:hypothetical protein